MQGSENLDRLFNPKSIAVLGSVWALNVIAQLKKSGYRGEIWPVHRKRRTMDGLHCFSSVEALPAAPDAAFVAVNRDATIEVVRTLSKRGAGGAICFASGFSEDHQDKNVGTELQADLIAAAGDMVILGPNCYGILNYLDNVVLWPDQHGGSRVDQGVALIGQSSNILLNLTMQARGLPISHVVAAGNQAQMSLSRLGRYLLADERVTALGLYIEGFGDIVDFVDLAQTAERLGKPIVAIKAGKSEKAQTATLSHTASLAGGGVAASALLRRLGIIEVDTPAILIETLKILHGIGPLSGAAIASMSCSGGEASLMADLGGAAKLEFRDFSHDTTTRLKHVLGDAVVITNPLDYHTLIWHDVKKLEETYRSVLEDGFDLTVLVMDVPAEGRCDPADWEIPLEAAKRAAKASDGKLAVLTSLPESLPYGLSADLLKEGIVPLHGLGDGLEAIRASIRIGCSEEALRTPPYLGLIKTASNASHETEILDEASAKRVLSDHGLLFPKCVVVNCIDDLASSVKNLSFPVAVKSLGIAHKTEVGGVVLGLDDSVAVERTAQSMPAAKGFLIEEMVMDGVAEILVGVTRDTTGLFLFTIGAGGTLAELLDDTISVVIPTPRDVLADEIRTLKISKILDGYRGKPAADIDGLLDAIMAIQSYVTTTPEVLELDVNPIIVRETAAIAVDALVKLERPE